MSVGGVVRRVGFRMPGPRAAASGPQIAGLSFQLLTLT
jgi:hypothetical protein